MFFALGVFALVFVGTLLLASLFKGRTGEKIQAGAFVLPSLILLLGLLIPGLMTIWRSFENDSTGALGFSNYGDIFTRPENLLALRNTALWVILVPLLATAIGLLYAILIDRSPIEALAKALVFLPMAISMVGAGIIWKFVYEYRTAGRTQIGLLNAILDGMGKDPKNFLLDAPSNTIFLIIVMVWIQAGFAMTVLSAAIKAIPDDIIEAAKLDGVEGLKMFRFITLPSIRSALVVVLTTIGIGTLKVFDIVRTMTGGNFETSVIANEFYDAIFRYNRDGLGAAFAVLLFVLVVPIVVYNIVQMRKDA
ncbi:MAG: sugar ABC transporter permease [Dermatophilaceae bacterium]|nr:sugar ABC transporter permease [Actinomycetales bacterium]MBP8880511.1 sugar ABC transporter permease [Dermatophilaceae bacterium]MBP9917620.1 sugar ABC transporter permease [Dermatophilaceae bacterium]